MLGLGITSHGFCAKTKGKCHLNGTQDEDVYVTSDIFNRYVKYFGFSYCNHLTRRKIETMDWLMELYVNPEKLMDMDKNNLIKISGEIQSQIGPHLRSLDSANDPSPQSLWRQINMRTEYLFLATLMVLKKYTKRSSIDGDHNHWVEYFDEFNCSKYQTLDELMNHVKELTKEIEEMMKKENKL